MEAAAHLRSAGDTMELLTAAGAAARYRETTGRTMSAVRMRQFAQRGQIPATKPGREWLFTPAAVDQFAAQERRNMPKPAEPQ